MWTPQGAAAGSDALGMMASLLEALAEPHPARHVRDRGKTKDVGRSLRGVLGYVARRRAQQCDSVRESHGAAERVNRGAVRVCVKLDRLARSVRHLTALAAELEARGVDLVARCLTLPAPSCGAISVHPVDPPG